MIGEPGGRSDKAGNSYEIKCIISEMLKIVRGKNYSITIEPIGEDELGTDILVKRVNDDTQEHIQCKCSNGEKTDWRIADLKARGIIQKWAMQLNRTPLTAVSLQSPIGANYLETLINRATNTGDDPLLFYENQICTNGELRKEYERFCKVFEIELSDHSLNGDISRSINFLRRISIKQMPIFALDEQIETQIETLFLAETIEVKSALISWIIDGNILGHEITYEILKGFFSKHNLLLRSVDDKRDRLRLEEINREYRAWFRPIGNKLYERGEYARCKELIDEQKSFIISGHAGSGKSGCTEAIIEYCENKEIPYIAIKLDRKTPQGSCYSWGKNLGFSGSFVSVLHQISKESTAVIILDQLDALRWTKSDSRQALDVCLEVINRVNMLNEERTKKMCVVFVCRKYDIENDNNIKILFSNSEQTTNGNSWARVEIGELDENTVKEITGNQYAKMQKRLQDLLKNPGNLYIWSQIECKEQLTDCSTTFQLIEAWSKQVCDHSPYSNMEDIIEKLAAKFDENGKLFLPCSMLSIENQTHQYLLSSRMLVQESNRVGFAHQSILDYYISKQMISACLNNETIDEIIGGKERQTPIRRYQVQMFLQAVLEYDRELFLELTDEMLVSPNIRYNFKHLVYECFGQIENPDDKILQHLRVKITGEEELVRWINNVIAGRNQFISYLLVEGILDEWIRDTRKKQLVFSLLQSVSTRMTTEEVDFISKHSFKNIEDDKLFNEVIWHELSDDSDELFEYRMKLYSVYPEMMTNLYLQLKKLFPQYAERVARLLALWCEKRDHLEKMKIGGMNEIIDEEGGFKINNGEDIVNLLLRYLPQTSHFSVRDNRWVAERWQTEKTTERYIIEILKKANCSIIDGNPELFWNIYKEYMGRGFGLFDELILSAISKLPEQFSNRVMEYICSDFNQNIYDKTSGEKDQLLYVKKAISVHAIRCDAAVLNLFEQKLIRFVPDRTVRVYRDRVEQNKKGDAWTYRSFWGELQYELLRALPYDRLSLNGRQLINTLERKFGKEYVSPYLNSGISGGVVRSPISGKKISSKQWLQIITNKKIPANDHLRFYNNDAFESSIWTYRTDFHSQASKYPGETIAMVLKNKDRIVPEYVEPLYSGVAMSSNVCESDWEILEALFREYPCNMRGRRAAYFCEIIEKNPNFPWSSDVLDMVKTIAEMHEEPAFESNCETDTRTLYDESYSCVRGCAASAIEKLIMKKPILLEKYKSSIESLVCNDAVYVRMAALRPLYCSFDVDGEWASKLILQVYESDLRCIYSYNANGWLFRLYKTDKDRVKRIILDCTRVDDKYLNQIGGACICELFLRYGEFSEDMNRIDEWGDIKTKAVLEMAVAYMKEEKCREQAQLIISRCLSKDIDIDYVLSRLFSEELVDIKGDEDFIEEIISSKLGRKLLPEFIAFIGKQKCSIKDYGKVLISTCSETVNDDSGSNYLLNQEVSKIVFALYDECKNSRIREYQEYASECLDILDLMYEKQLGLARRLTVQLMER